MSVPITFLVDDSCPLVHVFRCHWIDVHHEPPLTKDGRPLLETIPNTFLDRFCDVVEEHRIAGKFSIVPAPGGLGDVVHGIAGHDPALTREWLEVARRRLSARFDFTPEGITHNLAVNLKEGGYFDQGESDWSQTQTREILMPYMSRQLDLLRQAGIDATGVTSPWVFGIEVEPEYVAAIVAAQEAVYGRRFSWYFLHMMHDRPNPRPWIAYQEQDTTLVSIPSTVSDAWWQTKDCRRTDAAYVSEIADRLLTADGRGGRIRQVLDGGGWPVVLTHWQSLFSNGLETGLRVLDELGRRVTRSLGDEVRWVSCLEMAKLTVESGAASSA